MTTTPNPTLVPVTGAGIGLTAAFTEINANASAFQAWGQSVDTLLAQLASQLYTPPVAAYTSPAVGGLQVYGANSTPWATATSTGKLLVQSAPYVPAGGSVQGYSDVLAMSAGTVFSVTCDTAASAFNFRVITISAGVPSVSAGPLALYVPGSTPTAWNNSSGANPQVVGAVALSASAVKVVYSGGVYTPAQNTFFAHAIVTNSAGVLSQVNGVYSTTASLSTAFELFGVNNRKRGMLTGAQGWLVQTTGAASIGAGWEGFMLFDRGASLNGSSYIPNANSAQCYDNIGGGFFVRTYSSNRPVDPVSRTTVELDYYDDQNVAQVATLRLVGQSYGSLQGLYALSSTLSALFYTDGGGFKYLAGIGVNTAAPPATALALLGATNASGWTATAQAAWTSPLSVGPALLYSPTDIYIPTQMSGTTFKLSHYSFNTTTLVWSYVSQVTVALGAGVAGITGAAPLSVFMSGPDQLCVLYYATATASASYLEVFTLS